MPRHGQAAAEPERVYGFFRDAGAKHLQFLPLTPRPGLPGAVSAAANPEAIGDFLCAVFDIWIRDDVGRVVVQAFGEALRPIYGAPHALCIHRETCGDVAFLERDGGCPKDRFASAPDGEAGLNHLCAAYKRFFVHSRPGLTRLAAHMKSGKTPRSFISA